MNSFLMNAAPVSHLNTLEMAVRVIIRNDVFHYTEGHALSPDSGKIGQPQKYFLP